MSETVREFVDSRGLSVSVDRQNAIVRGVKILGCRSRNGRVYPSATLQDAIGLYEGAKVNVNHAKGDPLSPRDYQDRIGTIHGVHQQGDGLFADLHFNPKHILAEQLAWDAANAPENVGFSHHVQAKTVRQGDELIVQKIIEVQSVDLVADPATTRGLFEGEENAAGGDEISLESLTFKQLEANRPDLIEAIGSLQESSIALLTEELDKLRKQLDRNEKEAIITRLLAEAGLPNPKSQEPADRMILDQAFLESVYELDDESAVCEMIEGRAALVRGLCDKFASQANLSKPISRGPYFESNDSVDGFRSFVEAIKG
jgi:hypothetical protein